MSPSPNVLIVEDDDDIRDMVDLLLTSRGYRVANAADGVEALALMEDGLNPDLILLDLMMPRMDGEELVRQLRVAGRLDGIPLVVMSGHHSVHDKARELAAAASLPKPVELTTLLETVARLIRPRSG
jgi:two-component system response regulator MprA